MVSDLFHALNLSRIGARHLSLEARYQTYDSFAQIVFAV